MKGEIGSASRRVYLSRASVIASLLFFGLAAFAWASNDPWKSKPYQQWNDKDISRLFTDSPWAKTVTVEAGWKPLEADQPDVPSAPSTTSPSGNGSVTGASRQQSGQEEEGEEQEGGEAAQPEAQFLVYWMSSKTMREAVARRAVLHNGKTAAEAKQYVNAPQEEYEIVVQGRDMTPFRQNDDKYFQSHSFLQPKKLNQKIAPSHVVLQQGSDGKSVAAAIFYFPKKISSGEPTIGSGEKNAEFSCKVGNSTLKASFNPQKMTDQTGEDL